MYDTTSTSPELAEIVKAPLKSDDTPFEVPLTTIDAPGRPVPTSESITTPLTVF